MLILPKTEAQEINMSLELTLGIIGFVLSVILIPLLAYVWHMKDREIATQKEERQKEIAGVKKTLESHIHEGSIYRKSVSDNISELRSDMNNKVNEIETELNKTKVNYVQRFSDLKDNINDKFSVTNTNINNLAVDIKGLITEVKNLTNDKEK